MDAEVGTVRTDLLGRHCELERLDERVRSRDHLRARRWPPVAEREEPDLLHEAILADGGGSGRQSPRALA
jgi:hypothetical protein